VISRDRLSLEKSLGEGEFGLVVKATIAPSPDDDNDGYVAVKMLKRTFILGFVS